MASLTIRLFGYPQILVDNTPVKVERRKTLALVAYLAVETWQDSSEASAQNFPTQPGIGRERLAALLWPDCPQEQAGAYLRQALWDFAKAAGENWMVKNSQFVCLNPKAQIWVDVKAFTGHLTKWKSGKEEDAAALSSLSEAASLYQSDFLAGFTLRDCPAFDDWQALQVEIFRLYMSQVLEAMVRLQSARDEFDLAGASARRWVTIDPFNEGAHRACMRLYEGSGQHTAALRQFEDCQRILHEELGAEPEVATVALYEQIRDRSITKAIPEAVTTEEVISVEKRAVSKPAGTVTFVFTDIEGSTRLWEHHPESMKRAFARQESIIREVMAAWGGYVYKMVGDAFQVAFSTAQAALEAALAVQKALIAEAWGEIGSLKVRMALHTGVTEERGDDYVGPSLNRVARLLSAGHGGQILLTLPTAELIRDDLPGQAILRDLGEWRLKDLIRPEHIYQLAIPDLPQDFPPLRTDETQPRFLPLQNTPFMGREAELAKIEGMLKDPECRLISLVGIGGTGKTRLAIQAAEKSDGFPQGVFFVGLAPVSTLGMMISAISEALKLVFRSSPGSGLPAEEARDQLFQFLAEKKALMVLDNFEQLISCAGFLSDLLDSATGVKLIVTSRERLNLKSEWVLEVSGLPFPGTRESEQVSQYSAAQLFVKVAERIGPFTPSQSDWPAIARICQLLEGLPLGVEMAAAWVKMLSCQEIAVEIERDLDFLSATWHGMPERHRTLRVVFDYSCRLLPEYEREVFYRLSVFRTGFSREAALEIAGASLHVLTTLADKSFIRRISSGRFEIHPVLKQYASEKLASDPAKLAEVRSRFASSYGEWLSRMYEKLKGSEQLVALSALRDEMPNLHAAWQWMVERYDFDHLNRLLPAMILFHEMNDRRVQLPEFARLLQEMANWLRPSVSTGPGSIPEAQKRSSYAGLLALTLAGLRLFTFGFTTQEQCNLLQQESVQLASNLPDGQEKAFSILLNCIGPGSLALEKRYDLLNHCVAFFTAAGDAWGLALAKLLLGDNADLEAKDTERARPYYEAALEGFNRLINDWGKALCLNGLMSVEFREGNLDEACRLGCQALEIFSQLNNVERMIFLRHNLGEISLKRGALEDTRRYFEANLAYFIHVGEDQPRQYYVQRLAELI